MFSKAKIVTDERRADVLAECKKTGRYFICHKSQDSGTPVVCRGFYDEEANQACQVAGRLGLTKFVDPTEPHAENPKSTP